MKNPFSIAGKTILVTGAGSGIGRATSVECARMGANVIVTDINGQSLEETLSMLDVSCGQNHSLFVADLTNQEKLDELVAAIPVIDGLVSNAGISKVLPIQFLNDQDFNRIMDINAFAPMYLTQKIYKKKKISKGGSIVFTVSISGVCMVSMGGVMYAVSKNALDAFMRNAALEFAAKNIRVNSVNPSRVNTNLIKNNGSYSQEDLEKDMLTYPLRRYAEPEEIAYAIIYLLSDASAYVTGHSLIIDGGKTLM
ncbi:MAG: SDR family oxidoreductase [Bacteroidaceae bacterium]|nr:SDR family oxidoreductase [Bacteroidaceae bacterium]